MNMAKFGRPELTEVEKLRRAALRQEIKVSELKALSELYGDDKNEIEAMTGPGARPKSRSKKLADAVLKLEHFVDEYTQQEKHEGLKHVPLDKIRDPLVENALPVGRPEKDEFSILDRKLSLSERKLRNVVNLWTKAGDVYPPAVTDTASGKRKGRLPIPFTARASLLLIEITGLRAELKKREFGLTYVAALRRELKVLRDIKRDNKKAQKDLGLSAGELVSNENAASLERQIKHINELLTFEEKRRAQGLSESAVEQKMPVSISITAKNDELQNLVTEAEKMIEVAGYPPEDVMVMEDEMVMQAKMAIRHTEDMTLISEMMNKEKKALEQQQAYLALLKQKKAVQEEIERMEKELKAGSD